MAAATGQPYADQLKLVQKYTDAAQAAEPMKTAGGIAANTAALGGLALIAPEALGMDADALATTNMGRAAMTGGILRRHAGRRRQWHEPRQDRNRSADRRRDNGGDSCCWRCYRSACRKVAQ